MLPCKANRKGTTTLTLTDNVTGDKETVEVKVTDWLHCIRHC